MDQQDQDRLQQIFRSLEGPVDGTFHTGEQAWCIGEDDRDWLLDFLIRNPIGNDDGNQDQSHQDDQHHGPPQTPCPEVVMDYTEQTGSMFSRRRIVRLHMGDQIITHTTVYSGITEAEMAPYHDQTTAVAVDRSQYDEPGEPPLPVDPVMDPSDVPEPYAG